MVVTSFGKNVTLQDDYLICSQPNGVLKYPLVVLLYSKIDPLLFLDRPNTKLALIGGVPVKLSLLRNKIKNVKSSQFPGI